MLKLVHSVSQSLEILTPTSSYESSEDDRDGTAGGRRGAPDGCG